ncbi:MAG: M66 family metalloprotease [Chloroflexota bacterium]|nr:M66 family metalloprotease [Chloroflexota bacterium]
MTGTIPGELGKLKELTYLDLRHDRLTGGIPIELTRLTSLSYLNLAANQLSGTIPPELGKLVNLSFLYLAGNWHLTGEIPVELTSLQKLEIFWIRNTQTCLPDHPRFHEWLEAIAIRDVDYISPCPSLDRIALVALFHATGGQEWIYNDNWKSGPVLENWYGVSTDSEGRVEHLNLESNNLTGVIPEELGQLVGLKSLHLGGNPSLTGPVPHTLTKLPLVSLRLDGTQLCAPADAEFQAWLLRISDSAGVATCGETEALDDRKVLTRFYHVANGTNWNVDTNWLSESPLEQWHGVTTDALGRVIKLELQENNLAGTLSPALGNLSYLSVLDLHGNQLEGFIPAELGLLTNLTKLELRNNRLTGSIPAELGQSGKLVELELAGNQLTGSIPAELGQLANLKQLNLRHNKLTDGIPPELGQLTNLKQLILAGNQLTGGIPSALGQLINLESLILNDNHNLGGHIPPELGRLANLTDLSLSHTNLTGGIPSELGKLTSLRFLTLGFNQLTGSIPVELGRLSSLTHLWLNANLLTGRIPVELGNLANLYELNLSTNLFTGELPTELSGLVSLKSLDLRHNAGLSGPIPISFSRLDLNALGLEGTNLCMPTDTTIQNWLQDIADRDVIPTCRHAAKNTEVYLTQAVQSFTRPVPLIENEPALLRVFMSTEEVVSNFPAVSASFFLDGNETYRVDIPPGGYAKIPTEIDEGSLENSANAVIPAEEIVPGLEMVVRIGPESALDPESGIDVRVPESGRMAINVQQVPPFDLTLVPLLWMDDPDYSVVTESELLTADDDLFRLTRDLLPINDFQVSTRDPLYVSLEPVAVNRSELLKEVLALHKLDGKGGHYMGVMKIGGRGSPGNAVFLSPLDEDTIVHELGHTLDLSHAPCGGPDGTDPDYPYPNGNIGAWGYDILSNTLVHPTTPDFMSYCYPNAWVSDYHFNLLLKYRQSEEYLQVISPAAPATSTRAILLWGGLNENGALSQMPAFVVDSESFLPRYGGPHPGGPYLLEGKDAKGSTLFTLRFAIDEIAEGTGGGSYAFAIPAMLDWSGRLERILLSGPEGFSEVNRDSDWSAALLLDQSTGMVRGILRDWPNQEMSAVSARRMLPEPGLDVIVSPGIPDPSDW